MRARKKYIVASVGFTIEKTKEQKLPSGRKQRKRIAPESGSLFRFTNLPY